MHHSHQHETTRPGLPVMPVADGMSSPVAWQEDVDADADLFSGHLLRVAPRALRLARSAGWSSDEAADVVQEASISAWRHRRQCRGEFDPWFLAIVHRRATRRRRPTWFLPLHWTPRIEEWPGDPGLDPELATALMVLPVRQRTALWLRYGCDMSTAAVAQVLGSSDTATKQLLLRAREAVRRQLTRAEGVR